MAQKPNPLFLPLPFHRLLLTTAPDTAFGLASGESLDAKSQPFLISPPLPGHGKDRLQHYPIGKFASQSSLHPSFFRPFELEAVLRVSLPIVTLL